MAKMKHSEAYSLEQSRVALDNVVNQPTIATKMAEFGYAETLIAEGKNIWQATNNAYLQNKTEDDETNEASVNFSSIRKELTSTYAMHRKKAKVIFRKDALTADKLGITGRLPKAYIEWLETVKKFYSTVNADTAIQTKLVRLKITNEDLVSATTLVAKLETARAKYLREKGESQDATKTKDQAFAKLEDWMSEFYAVAAIALKDSPQLIESLSKVLKS